MADIVLVDDNLLADLSILQDANRLICIMQDGSFHKDPTDHAALNSTAAE